MNDNDLNLIEAYIEGRLHGEALMSFEKRLKSDELLSKEYNLRFKLKKLWVDADDYSSTKTQISNIFNNQKTSFFRVNRYYIMSIAATIIILAGVYFLLFHENNSNIGGAGNQFTGVSDLVSKENIIEFQYDEPDMLATIDSVAVGIELLFPINGVTFNKLEPIIFKWKSNATVVDTIFICNEQDNKVLLKLRVNLADTAYTIKYPQFTAGKYYWYISDITQSGKFNITENQK